MDLNKNCVAYGIVISNDTETKKCNVLKFKLLDNSVSEWNSLLILVAVSFFFQLDVADIKTLR